MTVLRRLTLPLGMAVLGLLVAGPPLARPLQEDHVPTPLEEAMEGLQSGQRRLRKLVEQPESRDTCVEVLRGMQASALAAFSHPPELPPGEEATPTAWRVGFQRQILALVDELLVLEQAVDEGRVDDAQAAYGELSRLKNDGHDRYQHEE